MHEGWAARLEQEGFAILPEAVLGDTLEALLAALVSVSSDTEPRRRGGVRNLFESIAEVRDIARSGAMRAAAEAVLGPGCFDVRALLFDKTPEANWKVIWHQDLTMSGWWRCACTSTTAARRTVQCESCPAPTGSVGLAPRRSPRGESARRPSSASSPEAGCW